jgi:hypothetical protein
VLEKELQQTIVEAAQLLGYKVFHQLPAMNRRGQWGSFVQGDKGFPDLVLVKAGKPIYFLELKSAKGRLTPGQKDWGHHLEQSESQIVYAVVRPSNLDSLIRRLQH